MAPWPCHLHFVLLIFILLLLSPTRAAPSPPDSDDLGQDNDTLVHPPHNHLEPDSDFQLSKEDLRALGLNRDTDNGPDLSDDTFKTLGLSEAELAELKKMEEESGSEDALLFPKKKDERLVDAPPPPGMVGGGEVRGMERKEGDVPKPHEPKLEGFDRADRDEEERKKEEGRMKEMERMKEKVGEVQREVEEAQREAREAKAELTKAKVMFQEGLNTEKEEHRIEREELTSALEERKRAFDELFEEKRVLRDIISNEQKTLHELQDKIQHPDLGLWIRQRAERAAILVETPETDAMKFYARKYMAPKVNKMQHRLALLEKRVEKSVDHLLPAKYGSVVALLLSVGLVGFPVFVTMATVVSVTKSVSLRQYVLLGNVFLTAFSSGLCIAGLILRQDPLQTLYEASESLFVILQIAAAVAFPLFVGVILCAVLRARDQEDLFVFGCELVFYVLVGLNYRVRVWRPAMLGEHIETSRMMYAVYVIDFLSMTALTISSAKMDRHRLPSYTGDGFNGGLDVSDSSSKPERISGSAPVAGPRSGLSSVGSGFKSAMTGGASTGGKEE